MYVILVAEYPVWNQYTWGPKKNLAYAKEGICDYAT
jgi:hypothetical protein